MEHGNFFCDAIRRKTNTLERQNRHQRLWGISDLPKQHFCYPSMKAQGLALSFVHIKIRQICERLVSKILNPLKR